MFEFGVFVGFVCLFACFLLVRFVFFFCFVVFCSF